MGEIGALGGVIEIFFWMDNYVTGGQVAETLDNVQEKIRGLTSGILESQEESNSQCPEKQVCIVGGQCKHVCESENHLLITEIGPNYVEIFNGLPKTIELDNYLIQGIPFSPGSVI